MFEIYEFNGEQFKISLDQLDQFKLDFPEAKQIYSSLEPQSTTQEPVEIVEGKGMLTGETEVPSGLGGLVRRKSLMEIKPKNSEEAITAIRNIRKDITENDADVIGAIAEEYFNLDNFERFRKDEKTSPGNFTPSELRGTVFHPLARLQEEYRGEDFFRNTEEEDLKRYFESATVEGDFTKYEQYKEYRALIAEGKTPQEAFNLDWVNESTKSNAITYRRRQLTQQYIAKIDDDEIREDAELAAEAEKLEIFEPNEDYLVAQYIKLLKEDRKLKKQYDDEVGGLGIHNRHAKGVESKAEKFLIKYLEKKRKGLERDSFNFEVSFKRFEDIKNKYEKELIVIQEEFNTLGNVGQYSSREEIAKYNELAAKQNAIINRFNEETKEFNIIEKQTDLLSRVNKYEKAINTVTEADEIAKAFALNYNIGERTLLHLEKSLIGSMAGLGFGTLKYISDAVEGVADYLIDPTGIIDYGTDNNFIITDYFQNTYAAHLDYQESLDKHMESTLPLNIPWKDVGINNIGEVSGQLLANNSFSILSALLYGGAVGTVSRLGPATVGFTIPQATKMLTQTFFTVEGGGKLSEMEIAQQNATKNIKALEEALPYAVTQDERLEILNQIDAQDKALNTTQIEKAFATVLYGGIAAYAEKLGTLGYVRRLNTMLKAASRPSIRNAIKGAGAFTINSGIEYVEELITQVGHNLTDIKLLDQNKSIIAGVDAEFNMNVLFSTMAVQSPSVGKNIYNSIVNEIKSTKEIAKDRQRRDEILEWKAILDRDNKLPKGKRNLSTERRDAINRKINDLLKEAGIVDSYTFANAAQMTRGEIDALFEKQAKKRDEIAAIRDLGAAAAGETEESNRAKRERKRIIGNINQLDYEMDELLLKPEQRNNKTVEEILGKENVEAETNFYYSKYQAAKQIAKGLGNVVEFKDDIVDGERVEGSGIAKLEAYVNKQLKAGKINLQDKNKLLQGFKKGNYASFIGNDVLLMENNIINGLNNATSNLERSMIAYAPFHELQHINDVTTGLVKDGDVVESQKAVVKGIEDHLETLYKRGGLRKLVKIRDKFGNIVEVTEYDFVKGRIASYTDKGGVDLMELLTIAGELKDAGVLNQESIDPLLSLKFLLNKFIRRYFGDNEMFFKLKNTDQVLQYIDSFQRSAKGSTLMLGPEEETKKVNFSQIYQEVEAMYNEEAWADPKKRSDLALNMAYTLIPEIIRRMQNVNLEDYIKEDIAVDFATSEQRGLFGLIKKYDKEVNDSVMGYLNSFVTTPKGRFKLFDLRLQEFYQGDPRYGEVIQSMEQEGVGTRVAKLTDETNLEKALEDDTKKPKIDVLKVGKTSTKEQDIIKAVDEKGDFKDVVDNNTGKIGNIIFNIPAKKIEDPTANITTSDKIINPETNKPVKKGETGIPERSEATNIQDHFADINTTKDFIRLLNLTNVTEKDADINKVGENIEVSRDVLGRAIGLPRRILDYFYRPKFKADGKRVRSQGKTSQVPIWELKPEFKNLTDEQLTKVAEQFQKDLGITGKQQINKLPTKANRSKIGQLLKGAAVVVSQQASLSAAQRVLEQKRKQAEKVGDKEKVKVVKQTIANITAAQSKIAFSKAVNVDVANIISKARGKKVEFYSMSNGTMQQRKAAVDRYIDDIVDKLVPLFEKYPGLIGTSMLISNNLFGITSKNKTYKPIKKYAQEQLKKRAPLFAKRDTKYSKKKFATKMYKRGDKDIMLWDLTDKEIQEINDKNIKNFDLMWDIISEGLRKDATLAEPLFHFFDVSQNEGAHLMRLGAPLEAIDITTRDYHFEHALQNKNAYHLLLLAAATLNKNDFEKVFEALKNNYKLIAVSKADNKKIDKSGYKDQMSLDGSWNIFDNNWWQRYFNQAIADLGGINPNNLRIIGSKNTLAQKFNVNIAGQPGPIKPNITNVKKINKAIEFGRSIKFSKAVNGITVLDFDDTLATTKSLVRYTTPDGKKGTLNAEEYASTYQDLLEQGYKFDFSEFNKVVKGKLAPLFQKALKLQGKFGPENMFVLTARPPAAQRAIYDFLKANGLNIPLKNITGLGNSTAESKALWIADKVGEGYNDFYFADDALQNVQAVKNMLDQFDVKSKVQQAKVKFSKSINNQFNDILENITGIESKKRFSAIKARKRGAKKGRFRFFIPPSHEDFVGLLYNFMGKGKIGNQHRDFFEKALIRPLNRAYRELNAAKQSIANDYKALNKRFPNIKKKLTKKTPDGDFTYQDAIRVYLWDKHGYDISGLSKADQQSLVDLVMNDIDLKQYADALNIISKQETYIAPTESWEAGDIRTDLDDATGRIGRGEFFVEFLENADIIFSQENLNKIEAAYGADVVSAIKDMLYRIKTGQNRPSGQNALVNKFLNYLNGSVASTMFFNIRSAVLQQMSMVNFINFADNNIIAAAKAFANQKQYWADWAKIFNSDFMKQRRKGIQTDVNGAELAASVKNAKNPIQAVIKKLLELGFLPTQIGDNIAIATGGATFLRNRINTYLKQGLSQKEAEAKAWTDFEILAEATQQSARPDMVSQQQASPLGKVILAFQNVTSQFNRLGKKAFLDLKNRRITPGNQTQLQSDMSNLSRMAYYFAIQNLIFYSLQSALFMAMFDDNEEDERWLKKKERMIHGSIDSVLRGTGVWGAVIATLKNMARKWHEQRDKGWNKDESAVLMEMLNVSPPLGIKARKMVNAEKTLNYNKDVIKEMETFDIDNPQWSAVTSYTEAITNVPLNRLYNKTQNVRESLDNQHNALERVLMFSGWSKWNLGIGDDEKIQKIKEDIKRKKKAKKSKSKNKGFKIKKVKYKK